MKNSLDCHSLAIRNREHPKQALLEGTFSQKSMANHTTNRRWLMNALTLRRTCWMCCTVLRCPSVHVCVPTQIHTLFQVHLSDSRRAECFFLGSLNFPDLNFARVHSSAGKLLRLFVDQLSVFVEQSSCGRRRHRRNTGPRRRRQVDCCELVDA